MSFWDNLKNIFSSEEIKLNLDSSFELKKAFDARRVGIAGRPQYPSVNFENLFAQANRNELVFACLEKIGNCALDAEIIVERKNSKGGFEAIAGHPLTSLINKPNSLDTGDTFLKSWLISEHISDRAVAEIVRSKTGQPAQLWLLNPCRIHPVSSDFRNGSPIAYYEYLTDEGHKVKLETTDVLIRVNRSITNQFYGIAPLSVALGSVDADSAMTDYVRAFFNNSGMPSGILKFTNRTLTEDQAEQTRQQWRNRYGRGGRHERGLGVLDQNAEFQKIGSNLDELESDSISGRFETRICQVFGVPPILVGAYVGLLHVNQRASVREAQQDFWLNKMSPLFKSLRQFLTWNLLPEFEDIEKIKRGEIRVNWDMSQVLALQEDLNERHDRARKNFLAGGLKLNEFRAEIGRDADTEADYYLRPSSAQLQSSEAAAQIAEITGASETDEKTDLPKSNKIRLELKAAATHEFSSTQLDILNDEKKILLEFGKSFIETADLVEDGREDKPHITVKYGLHTDNADELKELLTDVVPFEVTLKKTSVFSNKDADYEVVKIDVDSKELHAINKLISDNLKNTDTHPKYIPHLTIAYVAKGKGKKYVGDKTFEGQKIYFDKITFSDKNRKKTVIKLADSKNQKKTFDYDGVILSRPPNETEKNLDIKSLQRDFESNQKKIAKVLLTLREDLLKQAFDQIENIEADKLHTVILTPPPNVQKNLKKALIAAVSDGQSQVAKELSSQKNADTFEIKSIFDDISNLSDITISRIINEIQSRFSSEIAAALILGLTGNELLEKIKTRFKDASLKFFENIASRAATKAINSGRTQEMIEREDEIKKYQYSAIFDKNLCEYCKKADGLTANKQADLPRVPNKKCLGDDQCRCLHIAVAV